MSNVAQQASTVARHGVGQNVAHEWCGHTPPPHWLSAHLGVAALPQPPKSQLIHAMIVPAQDFMRRNALSFIAVNGDRFRCIQPRIRTRDSWCSGRVACGGRPLALLLAAAGTYTRPQSTIWKSASGVAARSHCADLRHVRVTLDTTLLHHAKPSRAPPQLERALRRESNRRPRLHGHQQAPVVACLRR